MKKTLSAAIILAVAVAAVRAAELPREWIDPETGHRIVQLSTEPGTSSLYFTQYAYTAGGTKLVVTTRHGVDLITLATGAVEQVIKGRVGRVLMTGRKTGDIYYADRSAVYAFDPATKTTREVAKIPPHGSIVTVNADETLVAGTITHGATAALAPHRPPPPPGGFRPGQTARGGDNYPDKHAMMDRRLAAHLPMTLFTINTRTGEYREWLHSTDWLNHLQFSPTDPTLLLYCHEGRQWKVDRVWLLRLDGHSQPFLVQRRTMKMEIAVHEYWSEDGQWVWYDLQTPISEVCWVAGYNVHDGRRVWYHVPDNHWCVHYNTSPDGRLFCGDGSDEQLHYAHAKNAKWIFLFHPELTPDWPGMTPDQAGMIQGGHLRPERLVDLARHDYSLEPNSRFTPDGKWIIFRSNLRGPIAVYAVEVAKARPDERLPARGLGEP